MQEPTLLVLTALADAARHGYAIAQEVKAMTGGRVALRTGALYGALDRLLAEGLIDIEREETVDGRARRIFTLSPAGRERLAAEAERLAETAREASRRLSVTRPSSAAT
ncbi:PadR family transcriptional regulator [Kitasatospora sp. NPDC056446]|uniref:PadR family transcriptional regulator n=1 Tax=Kitasatospora sp. NPDC056446 TaxID=3345819 RepID=UPI0036822534